MMQIKKKIKFEYGISNVTIFQNDFEDVQCISESIESSEAVFPTSSS